MVKYNPGQRDSIANETTPPLQLAEKNTTTPVSPPCRNQESQNRPSFRLAGIQCLAFKINALRRYTLAKQPCVYILASKRNGTLYAGVTSNPGKRTGEHKNDRVDGFTKEYSIHILRYDVHETIESAIARG